MKLQSSITQGRNSFQASPARFFFSLFVSFFLLLSFIERCSEKKHYVRMRSARCIYPDGGLETWTLPASLPSRTLYPWDNSAHYASCPPHVPLAIGWANLRHPRAREERIYYMRSGDAWAQRACAQAQIQAASRPVAGVRLPPSRR